MFDHAQSLFEIDGDGTLQSGFHQPFCDERIPADLLQHEIQIHLIEIRDFLHLSCVSFDRIQIHDVGIRQYLSLPVQIKSAFHKSRIPFDHLVQEHLSHRSFRCPRSLPDYRSGIY